MILQLIPFFKLTYDAGSQACTVSRPDRKALGTVWLNEGFVPASTVMITADELLEIGQFTKTWEGTGGNKVIVTGERINSNHMGAYADGQPFGTDRFTGGHEHKDFEAACEDCPGGYAKNALGECIPFGSANIARAIGTKDSWHRGGKNGIKYNNDFAD